MFRLGYTNYKLFHIANFQSLKSKKCLFLIKEFPLFEKRREETVQWFNDLKDIFEKRREETVQWFKDLKDIFES